MTVIADLWDPTLAVEGGEDAAKERCRAVAYEPMMVCAAVVGYKRRLGGNATTSALAADKRIARQVAHALCRVVNRADEEKHDWRDIMQSVEPDHRVQAAVLKWDVWLPARTAEVRREAVWAATWVMKINLSSDILRGLVVVLDYAAKRLGQICETID